MFEDRLWSLRKNSSHFNEIVGQRMIRTEDLFLIAYQYASNYGYDVCVQQIVDERVPFSGWRGSSFADCYENGRPFYAVSYCRSRLEREWFVLAHEISHILLHHQYLTIPFNETRQEIEEEGHFFAQLCFWPVNYLFSADYLRGQVPWLQYQGDGLEPPLVLDEEGIIRVLVEYQLRIFERLELHANANKLPLFAYLFLRRMERLLPRNYHRLMTGYYPFI